MPAFTTFLEFLRTRQGILFTGLGVTLLIIGLATSCNPTRRPPVKQSSAPLMPSGSSNAHITLSRAPVPVTASPPRMESHTNKRPIIYAAHVDLPLETNLPPANAVPFGRLLQVQLFNTIESLAPDTPIIGLVTESLWHNGEVIIPAGCEVHGQAHLDRVRERVVSNGPWKIVWQTGEQLSVSGIALDREFDANGHGWGITDGSAGIRGDILRSDSLAEVKLFLATALSGVSSGLQQTHTTLLGTQVLGTFRNASLAGSSQVLNTYAQQVLEAIKRDGPYVRVPAGKQFYLYLTEPIIRSKIRQNGGSR